MEEAYRGRQLEMMPRTIVATNCAPGGGLGAEIPRNFKQVRATALRTQEKAVAIHIPIIAYALAEGTGQLAATEEGKKNKDNLRAVSKAMIWIDGQAAELLSECGEEHYSRSSPFDYFEGSRVVFEPRPYEKRKLKTLLDFYRGRKICLLIPSHTALFEAYDDEVLTQVWDRRRFGYNIEIISVNCPEYPLKPSVGIPSIGITNYLIQNAMETEEYMKRSVKGSISQRKIPWA